MNYKEKLHLADQIIEHLKEVVFCTLWDRNPYDYGAERYLMPWIEEDSEYHIKKLNLKKCDEELYFEKIHRVFGEYSEVIPMLKKRKL